MKSHLAKIEDVLRSSTKLHTTGGFSAFRYQRVNAAPQGAVQCGMWGKPSPFHGSGAAKGARVRHPGISQHLSASPGFPALNGICMPDLQDHCTVRPDLPGHGTTRATRNLFVGKERRGFNLFTLKLVSS